jgi:hypothetical protein
MALHSASQMPRYAPLPMIRTNCTAGSNKTQAGFSWHHPAALNTTPHCSTAVAIPQLQRRPALRPMPCAGRPGANQPSIPARLVLGRVQAMPQRPSSMPGTDIT